MGMINDNTGIAYAMIYIMMTLIMVGAVWVCMSVIVDEYETLSNDLTTSHPDTWTCETSEAITDLSNIWKLVLWVAVVCGFGYGLVSAIRKERGGALNG